MDAPFEITEYCDGDGRTARVLTRSRSGGVLVGEYKRVEGPRPVWSESPDDPFDTARPMADRVRHAARVNAAHVGRAWGRVRALREHPLAGTPSIEPEEAYYHAVLSLFARWYSEYETPFPSLPPLPYSVRRAPDGEPVEEPLQIKAKEVCRLLSVSASTLDQLVSEGRLHPVRLNPGGDRYFTRQSVEDFVDELARNGHRR